MPRWVWAVLGWLVVVAATSTFAWLAISRAGDVVLSTPSRPLAGAVATQVPTDASGVTETATPTALVPPAGIPPASIPTAVPPPSTAADPTTGGAGGTGGQGAPGPSGHSGTPTPRGSTTSPPSSSTQPPGPTVQSFDLAVSLTGGQATVRCAGQQISLRSAIPEPGWTVLREERGTEVRVEFRSEDDESKLRAVCVDGRPSAETDDAGD